MVAYRKMEYALFSEWFSLDEDSPTGLSRKKDSPKRNNGTSRSLAGSIAGSHCVNKKGKITAWQVKLYDKTYLVHRIVWLLHTGSIPDMYIDHIDGDPLNNSIRNLRLVDGRLNSRNRYIGKNNKTGIIGVMIREDHQAAVATWRDITGMTRQRQFNFSVHGKNGAIEKATKARESAITELNLSGQGYTQRHGEHIKL